MNIIQHLAIAILARQRCIDSKNPHADVWEQKINHLMGDAPHGSGFDSGTSLGECLKHKITFHTSFHHMNEVGMYDGWTEHKVLVTPEFDGFDIRVTGRDRNGIKDYISEQFHHWLSTNDNGVEMKNADGVWLPCFGDVPPIVAGEIAMGHTCETDGWISPDGTEFRWE